MTVFYTLDVWDETTLWTTIEKGEAELHRLLERVGGGRYCNILFTTKTIHCENGQTILSQMKMERNSLL